ncbi:MAG: DEAD/DEAH box helicase [Brevinematia bacterium]
MEEIDLKNPLKQFYNYLLSSLQGEKGIYLTLEENFDEIKKLFLNYHKNILFLPSLDIIPYISSIPPIEKTKERLETIKSFIKNSNITIITTIQGLLTKTISQDLIKTKPINIEIGKQINVADIRNLIQLLGYEISEKVDDYGKASFKGNVIDIFPPNYELPIRIIFDFEEVVSIKTFDPETQLTKTKIEKAEILPPFENDFYQVFTKNSQSISFYEISNSKKLLSLVSIKTIEEEYQKFVYEITKIYEKVNSKEKFLPPEEIIYPLPEIIEIKAEFELFPNFTIQESSLPNYELLARYLNSIISKKHVIFLSPNEKYTKRSIKIFEKQNITYKVIQELKTIEEVIRLSNDQQIQKSIQIIEGIDLPSGIESKNLAIITVKELFNKEFTKYEYGELDLSSEEIKEIHFFENIKEGDYIVHSNYGIGIFRGITEINYQGKVKEFAKIEYQDGDTLYVPPEQFNLLSKYIGDETPKVNSLRQKNWKTVKQKVKESILKFSRDLLRLKALRQIQQKTPLKVDFDEYELLEISFPYEETPDQLKAIEEIKSDLKSTKVMDRIICGDVGFGKTEIAIRTAYLHILNGNQVMVLVPTTILAEQHYKTFLERLNPFGVKIGIISRLRKENEIKKYIYGISKGEIQILIGTHTLINEHVINRFKKLGLIIIDEEHKFGVEHKESILKNRENVDILTLSATPIPRTLGMGLSNLKDISLITTPPIGRKPIKTFIIEWNDEVIKEAINREISRKGQVLIINNKIKGIEKLKLNVLKASQGIIEENDICILHGQLSKTEIENTFADFIEGKYKIMISTTISESGLDIPNVNTVIINNAHLFGLADLHQIRGRVGRRSTEGYAYLIYPSRFITTELQMKRLNTIEEHSDLGAGFRIALKDLEIRGIGNILGKEQHGNMKAVGYIFYIRMLSETLKMINSGIPEENIEYSDPVVYLNFDRIFPEDFEIPPSEKMEIMLKLNVAFSENQINFILNEIKDRYGKIPEGVYNLSEIVKFRTELKKHFIEEIYENANGITIKFNKNHLPDGEKILELILSGQYEIEMIPNENDKIILKVPNDNLKNKLTNILNFMEKIF